MPKTPTALPPLGVPDDLPTPPPGSGRPTPEGAARPAPRPPAPSLDLLEQARQRSEVSPRDVPLVTHERVKVVEEGIARLEVNDAKQEERFARLEAKIDASRTERAFDFRVLKAWLQSFALLAPAAIAVAPIAMDLAAKHPDSSLAAGLAFLAAVAAAIARSYLHSRARADEAEPPPPAHT